MDPECVFCKIIKNQVPADKVYEDEEVLAFKDINPAAKVHVLVVPKKHFPDVAAVAEGAPELLARMVEAAKKIANEKYNGSYRLVFNTGLDAGQTVFHVHAHVLTGQKFDE